MTRLVVLSVWALVAAGGLGCEVLALASRGRVARFSRALGLLVATPWRMAVLVVGWMWLGWHFFAR